jgi:hypothetical protein
VPGGDAVHATVKVQTLQDSPASVHWTAKVPDGITVTPSEGDIEVPAGGSATAELSVTAPAGTTPGFFTVPLSLTDLPKTSLAVTIAPENSMLWNLNSNGISADDTNAGANFDGEGSSYSATALAAAGAKPGGTVSSGGFTFAWPGVEAGDPDNIEVVGGGQVLDVKAAGATRLSFLGSAAGGDASGTITLTYTDGSTQQATLGFSDWTLAGGTQEPSFGNTVALHTEYRDTSGGGKDPVGTEIFQSAPIDLQAGKQLASVTLPKNTDGGVLHVFSVATS